MPTVGQKRGARLPQGPKPVDEVEDRVIDELEDIPDDPEAQRTEVPAVAAVVTTGAVGTEKKEDGAFSEIKRIKIPEPPTKLFSNWESYDKYQEQLTEEHWGTLLWYMYRTWPRIVRPENEGYIDKGAGKLPLSYILRKHGSGEYQVILNNPSMPKLQRKVTKVNFKLMDEENPPLLNVAELDVDYKGNKLFVDQCISRGLLTTERKPMNVSQATTNGNQDQLVRLLEKIIDKKDQPQQGGKDARDVALAEVITIMGKGNEAATKLLIDQLKSVQSENDPDKLLKLVTAVMELGKSNQPAQAASSGIDMFKVLELLSKKDEKILELIGKIAEVKSGGGDGAKEDSFDTFLDRMGKWNEAMGLAGGESGSGRGGKKSTLEVILQYSMPAVEKALGLVQNLLYLKGQGVQPNPGGVGGVGGGGQQQQQQQRPAPGLGPVAVASPADGPQDVRDAMLGEAEVNQIEIIKKGVRQLGPQIIAAMERGTEGDAFGESIFNFLGPMAYNQIAGLGEDKLVEYLKLEPEVWNRLATVEPALRVFIKEFIAYGSGDSGEPTEEELQAQQKQEEERQKQAKAFEGTSTGRRGVVS